MNSSLKAFALLITLSTSLTASAADWHPYPLRENGTIPVWTVLGPFPNGTPQFHGPGCFGFFTDFLKASGGEANCTPSVDDSVEYEGMKKLSWILGFTDPTGLLDYIETFEIDKETPGAAYAYCRIESPVEQKIFFLASSNDGIRMWLNGQMIHENHVGRTVDEGGIDRVPATLQAGANNLMVKVDQGLGGWGQRIILADPNGNPLKSITLQIQSPSPLLGKIHGAKFAPSALIAKTPQGERQIVMAQILSGGLKDAVCRISKPEWNEPYVFPLGNLPLGKQQIELQAPVITQDGPASIVFESEAGKIQFDDVPFTKCRKWTIDLIQHTHTDIGYTRPQDELLPAFLRQIDNALDYCDLTDDYPEESKFRWTCEVSWPVKEYLLRRPSEQIARLKKRVAEGRIEIAALFLNMDELADENMTARSLQPIRDIREQGFEITTAMQNDVPGVAWCLADYFNDIGIKYLTMGINNDRTPRAFERPTAFWWESPSGKRVLAWRPDHYHTGNHLRIHQGLIEPLKNNTLGYLKVLEDKGYPFDRIAAQYSGTQIDNSPPAITECDLIRKWNELYAWPHLRSSIARDFLEYVESNHADELPVCRGAWPNWWTDGFAFTHFESAEARRTHMTLNVAEGMLSASALLGAQIPGAALNDLEVIREDLIFYDEHTYGAQETFSKPTAENTAVQWGEKVSHLWDAVKDSAMAQETAWGLLEPNLPKENVPTICVFNTLSWKRSGMIEVYIGHELLPLNRKFRIVDTVNGAEVPIERIWSRFEGSYWRMWVDDVPPLGYKTVRIEVTGKEITEENAEIHAPVNSPECILENNDYRIAVETQTGTISSLIDKIRKQELVDKDCPWKMGQLIVDRLTDVQFYDRESYLDRSTRTFTRNVLVEKPESHPLWDSIRITADADGFVHSEEEPGIQCELRLYKYTKKIEIQFTVNKEFVTVPESVYVGFPFAPKDGEIIYEAQGGLVSPGVNQLPGSSSDWHTVQNFITVREPNSQIVFGSDEIFLAQFGDINMGKWQTIAEVERPYIFSWVMNNYWTHNYRGTKETVFTWRYYVTSSDDTSNTLATRFGWESRTPLTACVFAPANPKLGPSSLSALTWDTPSLLLVNLRPALDGNGLILQLREVEGKKANTSFNFPTLESAQIDRVNVIEETLEKNVTTMEFKPFEVHFFRLNL